MVSDDHIERGRALRIAIGIMALVLMMVGGVGATKFIRNDATGGDCTSFGTWNSGTKTCTMTTDLTEGIQIDSDGITLDGNGHTITGNNTGNGVYLYDYPNGKTGVTIRKVKVRQFNYGIFLSGFTVQDNNLSDNLASNNLYGIVLHESHKNNLTNNTVSNNSDGIHLGFNTPSNDNNLIGNTVENNIDCGICIHGHSNNLLTNMVSNNSDGIYLYYSGDNHLTNNIISHNSNYGIYSDIADNTYFASNTISNNAGRGILLRYGRNNYITDNSVSNNSIGIVIYQEEYANIFNNYFNNIENSRLYPSYNNIWNTTKTPGKNIIGGPYLGGNFWAYSNGTGFSQSCMDVDKDGICDSQYTIDINNIDYLPLAKNTVGLPKTGDINGNGQLTLVDAIYLAKHVGGFSGYEIIYADGDINANGKVTLVDAIYLAKHVGEFIGYETIY